MPEEINCTYCENSSSRILHVMEPRRPYDNKPVMNGLPRLEWRICRGCGLMFLSPRMTIEEATEVYDESYHDAHHEELRGWEFLKKKTIIEKCVAGGALLDVGCGYGYFQKALGPAWRAVGIDMSPHACRFGKESLDLDLRCASMESLNPAPGSFDAVTLWDVVEHVPDPVAELRHASRALRSGGVVGVSTGIKSALVPRLAGKYWYFLNIPDHQFAFTFSWLKTALERFGFEIKHYEIHNRGRDFFIPFMRRLCVEGVKWSLGTAWRVTKSRAIESRLKDVAPPLFPMFNDIAIIAAVKK